MQRLAALLATALVAVGALAGCGSSSQSGRVSARTYVSSLCSAVLPFERSVVSHATLLNQASPNSPAASKKALQSFFSAVAADTSRAATKVHQAGTPAVANGQSISRAIDGAFSHLRTATSQAVSQAAALPTSSPSAFRTAASKLFARFRSSMGGIGSNLQNNALSSAALQRAARTTPACKAL